MKYFSALTGIFLIYFFSSEVSAQIQEVKIIPIPGASGLTLGKINDITQDKYGFMWFLDQTNQYVVRYDGSTMKRYTFDEANPDSPTSLGGIQLECLFADNNGIIWIGGNGWIDRLDPLKNTFKHYRPDPNDSRSLTDDYVTVLLVDHEGILWVGTSGGLDRFDPETEKFSHFRHNPEDSTSLSNNTVRSLYEDREGTLWVGTGFEYDPDNLGGLNKLDRVSGTFTRYLHDSKNPHSLNNNKVRSIFEDTKGNFWIGTRGGLHRLNRERGEFERMADTPGIQEKSILKGWVTSIAEDKENRLWIGTLNGPIGTYNSTTKLETVYNITSIWKIKASRDGHIWVSTENNYRLYKFDLYHTRIESSEDELKTQYHESSSIEWRGNSDGLVRVDMLSGKEIKFTNNPNNENSLSDNRITTIIKDHLGTIWVGTMKGLNRYNAATNSFTRYLHLPKKTLEEISRSNIACLYVDSQNNLWVCTWFGLGKYNRETDEFSWIIGDLRHFIVKSKNPEKEMLSSNHIMSIHEDADSVLWIGTFQGGISRFDRKANKFRNYLPGITAWKIIVDQDSVVWAGTWNGLYFYNPIRDRFERHAIEEGIFSIIEDDAGNIWVTAARGLYKIDRNREQHVFYGTENGLTAQEAMGLSYKGPGGEITFTRREGGYYTLDPEKLYVRKDTAKLYFTNFWVGNNQVSTFNEDPLSAPPLLAKEFKLKHDQNTFSISFTKVDFRASGDDALYYFMENYDQEWREASPEEKISYSFVPPGNYIFRIKGATKGNGIWGEKEIPITVLPPWYTTWWAYGFYGLVLVGGVVVVDRVQRKRILEKERALAKEKELEQAREIEKAYKQLKSTQSQLIQSEKMASLGELTAGIAHEIQNPLNFVNNFSDVNKELLEELKQEADKGNLNDVKAIANDVIRNEEKINHHGKRADAIVKGMLQHSRTSSGQKELTDINALCDEYLRLSYHGLRAKDKSFNATLKTDFDETIGTINIVPQDIGRVILNLINNAFYAVGEKRKAPRPPEGGVPYDPTVSVSTKKIGDKVFISVKDNGNGIPDSINEKIFQPFFTTKPTGQGTGLGLSLSYDIVKAHGGELKVETPPAGRAGKESEGAEFIVWLPV